jgi:beta-lactamase class A
VALEPVSGTKVSLRGDEEFMAASIGKLPPFVALYRGAARGELDLEEEISILPEDVQDYGFGGLNYFPTGHSLSLRECAYRLINHSDNTAWAMLERRLGEEKVKTELQEAGAENSRYLDTSPATSQPQMTCCSCSRRSPAPGSLAKSSPTRCSTP